MLLFSGGVNRMLGDPELLGLANGDPAGLTSGEKRWGLVGGYSGGAYSYAGLVGECAAYVG